METLDNNIFWLVIIICVFGLLVIAGIIIFAWRVFQREVRDFIHYDAYIDFLTKHNIRSNIPKYLNDAYSEYLQRRNEFWTTYGQVIIAVLIIIVLTILLLTKTISAEAGLPILSAVSGFAIAKGINTTRNQNFDPDRNQG